MVYRPPSETRRSTFRLVTTARNQKVGMKAEIPRASASCHHKPPRNSGIYLFLLRDEEFSKD